MDWVGKLLLIFDRHDRPFSSLRMDDMYALEEFMVDFGLGEIDLMHRVRGILVHFAVIKSDNDLAICIVAAGAPRKVKEARHVRHSFLLILL